MIDRKNVKAQEIKSAKDLALARSGHIGAGGTGLAIAIGGQVSPKSGTEEFTAPTGSLDVTLTT